MLSYDNWVSLFDSQDTVLKRQYPLPGSAGGMHHQTFLALVFHNADTSADTLQATLDSLQSSTVLVTTQTFDAGRKSLAEVVDGCSQDYIAIVQAGEIISPLAFVVASRAIAQRGGVMLAMADEDELDAQGRRHSPLFKPQPNHVLMLSGTLSRGIWFVAREVVTKFCPAEAAWAETVRLALWLRLYEEGAAGRTFRIPYILTHRRPDTQAAPSAAIAEVVAQHLDRSGLPFRMNAQRFPIDVQILPCRTERVSIIIPSSCRKPHVLRCLPGILANTDWSDFEIIIVVSQMAPLDDEQIGNLASISGDSRVRVLHYPVAEFNYSAANNYAVLQSRSPVVCFVNDDILPISADWLMALMGQLSDPHVAAVGAKLLFEDETIQHAGVVMGLAGLCEHIFRHLPRHAPGYGWRAVLDQELSAVTGACLLVRREVYDAVGGMDEVFASGFNDVDLCLKIRAHGHAIVWSAHAELFHFESASFGHHYAGERAGREMIDVQLMRTRWHDVCVDDPFYNPNLSLIGGGEGMPAFPPRHVRLNDARN
jgi:GT2 family glycosyltransferase